MASSMDVIKEYLVSLGFAVDNRQYDQTQQVIKDLSAKVQAHTAGMSKSYVEAAGIVTTALASITAATVALMDKVAQADLGYQKFALKMYMANDAAKQLKITTDALGESLEDIAWIPELRERYFTLMKEARGMEPSKEDQGELKKLRDIRFELTRLKVEATYGLQWIAIQLTKNLGGPLKDGKSGFKALNDYLQEKMPEWTEKVAKWLTVFIGMGSSAARGIGDMAEGLKRLWDVLSPTSRAIVLFGAIVKAVMLSGPVGRAVLVIGGLVTAIDDFYAYIDGRKSSKTLAPIWDVLIMAADTVVRSLVSATVLAENLYDKVTGKSKKTFKQIWQDVKGAWSDIPGTTQTKKGADPDSQRRTGGTANPEIIEGARKVAERTGLPIEWVYGQWAHETGNFTNRGARNLNNLAGLRDKNGDYMKFGSVGEFADYFASYIPRKYGSQGVLSAKTPEEYAAALKRGGYYEAPYAEYIGGLRRGIENYRAMTGAAYAGSAAAGGGNVSINNTIGDLNISITEPGASPSQMYAAAKQAVEDAQSSATTRYLRDFAGVMR